MSVPNPHTDCPRCAARAKSGKHVPTRPEQVYAAFLAAGPDGLTDEELADTLGERPEVVRPVRSRQLCGGAGPLVVQADRRRRSRKGYNVRVWRAIEHAPCCCIFHGSGVGQ